MKENLANLRRLLDEGNDLKAQAREINRLHNQGLPLIKMAIALNVSKTTLTLLKEHNKTDERIVQAYNTGAVKSLYALQCLRRISPFRTYR